MGDVKASTIGASQTFTVETINVVDGIHFIFIIHTPASVLINLQLTVIRISLWSRSMLMNLWDKSKLGIVLGTCKEIAYKDER